MSASVTLLSIWALAILNSACQTQPMNVSQEQFDAYAERMANVEAAPTEQVAPNEARARTASAEPSDSPLVGNVVHFTDSNSGDTFLERFLHHVPDPEEARIQTQALLAKTDKAADAEMLKRLIDRLAVVERPQRIRLTLDDAIRRALAHSHTIRVSSYNPAIEATRVVEAEAAFDATVFMNLSNNKQDRPAVNALSGTQITSFDATAGIRKLMPSGMQMETGYLTQRSSNNFAFQTVNPVWFSQFYVQFRQPLLRGFGLDTNRSQIRITKLGRRRSNQTFRRQIRDTLRNTEEAYWQLVQARRNLVVSARLLSSFEQIYSYLDARKEFDVFRIQLADTKARLERSISDYIELAANVRNAEDHLISLMNDPTIDLADEIEIIPVDLPSHLPVVLDRIAEAQAALDNRSEIAEAKIGIDIAKVQVGVAKNQTLPQLDAVFRYSVDGIGPSHDQAFDGVTQNNFHEYLVGIDFELPVGNRAQRAALARAKNQYGQALANLKLVFEQVILDVNVAVRQVQFKYDQIEPRLQTAEATDDQVASIIARAEKKDFLTLNNELNTRQSLAQARSALISALLDYGMAITDLERAKGTLLRYNNVDLVFDDTDDPSN